MQYAPGTPGAMNQLYGGMEQTATPALNALTQQPPMGAPAPAPARGADPRLGQLAQLDQLALQGNALAADKAKSMRSAMKFEKEMGTGGMAQGEQYMAVGKNVFDKATGRFMEPPTPEEVDSLKTGLQKGERWNAEEQSVETVPGSKLFISQNQEQGKDLQTARSANTKGKDSLTKIDEILAPKNAGAFEGNFGGYNAYATRMLPGENSDLRKKIDSFKSNMKAIGLELMRSGGSIGQMTEKEWPIVEQMLGAIDPVIGETEARAVLEQVRARIANIVADANAMYDAIWSETQYYKPELTGRTKAAAPVGGGSDIDALLDKYK
jgi:hypothetical protein